jgi:16S rRNA (adenine1518-N6/adenine1519-N6)-dimethyltransferase
MDVSTLPVEPTAVVANLPYNVAVPVVLHLLATFPSIEKILVMVQREVADRLCAEPGSRTYGVPSVKARWFGHVHYAGDVGRNVFWPAPNVDSGLVSIIRGDEPVVVDRSEVFSIVDAAFAQRRKQLRSALSGRFPGRVDSILASAGVDPSVRGEQLDVSDFVSIARAAASA